MRLLSLVSILQVNNAGNFLSSSQSNIFRNLGSDNTRNVLFLSWLQIPINSRVFQVAVCKNFQSFGGTFLLRLGVRYHRSISWIRAALGYAESVEKCREGRTIHVVLPISSSKQRHGCQNMVTFLMETHQKKLDDAWNF